MESCESEGIPNRVGIKKKILLCEKKIKKILIYNDIVYVIFFFDHLTSLI